MENARAPPTIGRVDQLEDRYLGMVEAPSSNLGTSTTNFSLLTFVADEPGVRTSIASLSPVLSLGTSTIDIEIYQANCGGAATAKPLHKSIIAVGSVCPLLDSHFQYLWARGI